MEGLNVNYDAIGQGIYDMMPENDQAVVAFGMIPLQFMELATRLTQEKLASLECEKWLIPQNDENIQRIIKGIEPGFIKEFQRSLTVSIFKAAKEAGRMIV